MINEEKIKAELENNSEVKIDLEFAEIGTILIKKEGDRFYAESDCGFYHSNKSLTLALANVIIREIAEMDFHDTKYAEKFLEILY